MNDQALVPRYETGIIEARQAFEELSGGHVNYGDEEIFAMQMLAKNASVLKTANDNPRSVQLAMINVASTGLTLNPAMGYAYLVPRDGAIVLDISFKGLIKIATDTGSIEWVRAECVHANDRFTYRGPALMPEITADPFRDRGEIIGAYCIAKTTSGDILTEVMDLEALFTIRDKSTAFTKGSKGSKGPWESFFSEMCRKAVIKRARKTWPYTDKTGRMAKAIEIANQAEGGYTFEPDAIEGTPSLAGERTPAQLEADAVKRKALHDAAFARNSESVAFIKDRIEADDMVAVAAEWRTFSRDDQMALYLAPTKGGCFTTAERKAIKERLPPAPPAPVSEEVEA